MATGGEVPGQKPDRAGSEDLDNLKCQLCLEDGLLHEAVGMCVDCNDTLCESCYTVHRRTRSSRNHKLIDKEQMLQDQVQATMKDTCTEKCEVHEDKVIEYYCARHGLLGCTVCVTLEHTTCKDVHYIPHVVKDLANNEEYGKAEKRLNSALETFKKVSDNAQQYSEELEASCAEAVDCIREFRRSMDAALGKMETDMIEKVEAIKAEQMKELAADGENYRATQEKLQSALGKVEALQQAGQNCSVFTEMMRMNAKLANLDAQIKEALRETSSRRPQIRFSPNQHTLETMKHSATFGNISGSAKQRKIKQAKHAQDLNAKAGTNNKTCRITGLVVLQDGRLVLADYDNSDVKAVNVQSGQMMNLLKLPSEPWGISAISNNKVAVTIPDKKEVAIIAVGDSSMSSDRTIVVNGRCWGVNYRNDKFAVSFSSPCKVEILSFKGSVIHTLSNEKLGQSIYSWPYYLTYSQDDTTLYISYDSNVVIHVKLDGTIVATYTDRELKQPRQPVVTRNGDVLVCGKDSNTVHQITKDCKKIQVLLNQADGLNKPYSICPNEETGMLYVGTVNDKVKVYKVEYESQ